MSYQVPLGYVPISSSALRPLGAAYIPILLSEVEQVFATVRASVHTPHMSHIIIFPGVDSLFLELEWSWLNFVVTWLKIFKPNGIKPSDW